MSYFHDHPHPHRRQILKRTFTFLGALAPTNRFMRAAQAQQAPPPAKPPAVRAPAAPPEPRK
ncbi:MAG: hypothetical protein DMG58_16265, partial [Acidobacteria bacterium]